MSDLSVCNGTKLGLKGVYTLIIRFAQPCKTSIRNHGSVVIGRGLYVYTGSALGAGSSSLEARIGRHLRRRKKKFWHIDRILACKSARVVSVVFAETICKMECEVNASLLRDSHMSVLFARVGSSDCRCSSHFLLAKQSLLSVRRRVRAHYREQGLAPQVVGKRGTVFMANSRQLS